MPALVSSVCSPPQDGGGDSACAGHQQACADTPQRSGGGEPNTLARHRSEESDDLAVVADLFERRATVLAQRIGSHTRGILTGAPANWRLKSALLIQDWRTLTSSQAASSSAVMIIGMEVFTPGTG